MDSLILTSIRYGAKIEITWNYSWSHRKTITLHFRRKVLPFESFTHDSLFFSKNWCINHSRQQQTACQRVVCTSASKNCTSSTELNKYTLSYFSTHTSINPASGCRKLPKRVQGQNFSILIPERKSFSKISCHSIQWKQFNIIQHLARHYTTHSQNTADLDFTSYSV